MVYKISVIVPCHDSESTLKTCIDSVVNQTIGFENIELILYDNASSDSTREIIQNYAEKYHNIVPFYSDIDSGFPGTGRNKGVEVASSEYIMFMDSDDEYDLSICEKLYDTILCDGADVVCCDKITIEENHEIKKNINHTSELNENGKIMITGDELILFDNITVWNKIFKKEIISKNNLRFLENTSADDFAFCKSYFLKSKKLIYLKDYYGYKWKVYSDSLSHDIKKNYITELISAYLYVCETFKRENREDLINIIMNKSIIYLLISASYLNLDNDEFQEVLNEIFIFENKINFSIRLDEKYFEIINRFILNKKFKSAMLCLKSLNKIRNIKRKIYRVV